MRGENWEWGWEYEFEETIFELKGNTLIIKGFNLLGGKFQMWIGNKICGWTDFINICLIFELNDEPPEEKILNYNTQLREKLWFKKYDKNYKFRNWCSYQRSTNQLLRHGNFFFSKTISITYFDSEWCDVKFILRQRKM